MLNLELEKLGLLDLSDQDTAQVIGGLRSANARLVPFDSPESGNTKGARIEETTSVGGPVAVIQLSTNTQLGVLRPQPDGFWTSSTQFGRLRSTTPRFNNLDRIQWSGLRP